MARGKSVTSLNKAVRRSIALSGPGVDSEQLLGDIIEEWGGTKNLAKDIKAAYDAAGEGTMIRQRFLEMIQRLIINNTVHEIGKTAEPSDMDDSELDAIASQFVRRIADSEGDDDGPQDDQGVGPADDEDLPEWRPEDREEAED